MQQKIKDLVLLVKHERKWQILLGVLVIVVLLGFFVDDKPRRYRKRTAQDTTSVATSADKASDELLEFSIKQKEELEARIKVLEADKQTILEKNRVTEDRTTKILSKIVERVRKIEDGVSRQQNASNASIAPEAVDADGLTSLFPEGEEELVKIPVEPARPKVAYISAGDSVQVELLTGVHARTDGDPYPVLFKLVGDVYGPDGSALPLGEARISARAQGSLIDHRAIIRLEDLNITLADGSRKSVRVDGYVVGEDGIVGMEGLLIDPIGKTLAAAGISAGIQGLGQSLNNQSNTSFSGGGISFSDSSQNAGGDAARGLTGELNRYIQERANLLVPVVKVLSGRKATVVFKQNVEIDGLLETLEEPNLVYASLD